jgi:hypothetical protein
MVSVNAQPIAILHAKLKQCANDTTEPKLMQVTIDLPPLLQSQLSAQATQLNLPIEGNTIPLSQLWDGMDVE